MTPKTLILIPGYNEPPEHFDLLRRGTPLVPGLDAYGITSLTFSEFNDTMDQRIDRFARFVDEVADDPRNHPIAVLGYSLGGLVARGYLKRYARRASILSHTITIATPHWGVQTLIMPFIHTMLRTPDRTFADMDIISPFIEWLNETPGKWILNKRGYLDWALRREPWVAPPGTRILSIVGLVPSRGGDNDGLVWGDSATLGSRIPAHFIVGPHANHMNVIGHFDPVIMALKGFLSNDRVWPLTLAAITRFLEAQPTPVVEPSLAP